MQYLSSWSTCWRACLGCCHLQSNDNFSLISISPSDSSPLQWPLASGRISNYQRAVSFRRRSCTGGKLMDEEVVKSRFVCCTCGGGHLSVCRQLPGNVHSHYKQIRLVFLLAFISFACQFNAPKIWNAPRVIMRVSCSHCKCHRGSTFPAVDWVHLVTGHCSAFLKSRIFFCRWEWCNYN